MKTYSIDIMTSEFNELTVDVPDNINEDEFDEILNESIESSVDGGINTLYKILEDNGIKVTKPLDEKYGKKGYLFEVDTYSKVNI
ncbi:MAG: hypothetical protein FWG36_02915 [Oscillospiraceae bacterium]|nr:hypothetical protein [Oscillospiraceae bacterium]